MSFMRFCPSCGQYVVAEPIGHGCTGPKFLELCLHVVDLTAKSVRVCLGSHLIVEDNSDVKTSPVE